MKILLIITVCELYKDRILNQIQNLTKFKKYLDIFNITPIFIYGNEDISINIPFKTCKVDVEEKYTNLHKKIIESFCLTQELDFDYLIKIDDDTIFNIDKFDKTILNESIDYIGRFESSFTKNYIKINLPMYNFYDDIQLYPSIFKNNFKFATGDFYILSKKAVNYIITKKNIFYSFREDEYICEDQLIGFILNDSSFKTYDINYYTKETQDNLLQITKEFMSLHPINSILFNKLILLPAHEQLNELINFKQINVSYRKMLINKLGDDIKKLLKHFANSKKTMGLG